ncbi:Dps family protein, partial [Actinomadura adrarensis]
MVAVKSPLTDDEARKTTGQVLQAALVDMVDLALVAKQAHWNLTGRNFKVVHEHLDEVVDLARTYQDEFAERAVAIGINPDGRARTVADRTKLPQL